MTKKNNRRIWIFAAIFALIGIAYAITPINSPKLAYDVVVFGDSVIGQDRTDTNVTHRIEQETGLTTFNAAIGGSNLTNLEDETNESWDLYSMVKLSEAYANRDFGAQLASIPDEYITYKDYVIGYAGDTLRTLPQIDLSKAKFIIVEQGQNDFWGNVPLSTNDPYDISSYEGALRTTLKNLKKVAPDTTIIVASTTYSLIDYRGGDCFEVDNGYGNMAVYDEARRKVAKEFDAVYADLLYGTGIDKETYWYMLGDGLHPTDEGTKAIADVLIDTIKNN